MIGFRKIEEVFFSAKEEGRLVLISYFVYGYPHPETSREVIKLLARETDIVEIGFPFSDPLADGATIQEASEIALRNGPKIEEALKFVFELRKEGFTTPLVLMSYLNPVYRYGLKKFVDRARESGLNGVIFPDLPFEEAGEWLRISKKDPETIFLVSPLTENARLQAISEAGSGFLYCLSVLGTTGARKELASFLKPFLKRVKSQTQLPVAVGFGFSQPSQIKTVKSLVDGVIVGSALIDSFNKGRSQGEKLGLLKAKIKTLKTAL